MSDELHGVPTFGELTVDLSLDSFVRRLTTF